MRNDLVLVRGGGRLGTAVAHRLRRCGFPVVVTEAARPTMIHRASAFGSAVYETGITVEGIPARRAANYEGLREVMETGVVPVFVDPPAAVREVLSPWVLVDATGLDRNTGTRLTDAPIVIGIGMGFEAGRDVHAVVDSREGLDLGRITVEGPLSDPDPVREVTDPGLALAPAVGRFDSQASLGQSVAAGEIVGRVGSREVTAPRAGMIRGLLMSGLFVGRGVRLLDVDERSDPRSLSSLDPRARAVAGGVLEAILYIAAVGRAPGQSLDSASGPAGT